MVTDLCVQHALKKSVTLALDVLNLFDRRCNDIAYEQDYRISPTSPAVPNGITVHPGEPREFRLTLKISM